MRTYTDYSPTFPDRADWTIPHALRTRAASHGDRVYLEVPHTGHSFTFGETLRVAENIAVALAARGHRPGERIMMMMPNRWEYILGWFGAALAGLAEVPINNAYRGSFLAHQVKTVAPSGAVLAVEHAANLIEVGEAASSIRRVYLVDGDGRDDALVALTDAGFEVEPFEHLLAGGEAELPVVTSRDLASVFFTSGTTGLSKGVMMSNAHMMFFADECVSLTRLTDRDTYMAVGPLFHGNAQFLAALPAMIVGARFVLRERFSASNWIEQVRSSGATVTNFVGVMMDFVWKQPPSAQDNDNDLRCVFAAPTASSIVAGFRDRFGIEAFVEVFGLTETSMPIMSPYGEDRPAGAAGLAVDDWFEVRLVDPETDEEVACGEVGELIVRPKVPFITTLGYFDMPDRTCEALRNCWFHTGDGLRRDEHGWYFFVDRLKDALRRRGENISSYELEQSILAHPAIAEVAVVGVPADQEAGEDEVMACVVMSPGAELSAEDFWRFCDTSLPYFAVPRFLRVVEELPKTPSEKVRKTDLRALGTGSGALDRLTVLGSMPGKS